VINFPAGCTILIPSAIVHHSNTAIKVGESWYSFTQYAAGRLFWWINNGMFVVNVKKKRMEDRQEACKRHWKDG
jgi:hypothetical protein